MIARKTAVFLISLSLGLFLWWPPEVYEEMARPLSALLFSFFLISLFCRPDEGSDGPSSASRLSLLPVSLCGLFFICLCVSSVFGADSYRSAETLLGYASAASALGLIFWSGDRSRFRLETLFIAVTACLLVYGLHQYLFSLPGLMVQPGTWTDLSKEELLPAVTRLSMGRVFSRFALPSTFSCVILAALPIVHRRLRESRAAWPYALLLALMSANIVMARSFAAVLLFFGYWWADAWIRRPALRRSLLIPASASFVLLVLYLRPSSLLNFSDPQNPVHLRLSNWSAALSEFFSHPLFGAGPGNFALLFPSHTSGAAPTRYAHGIHMTVLAETGAFGALAWLALSVVFFLWIWRTRPRHASSLVLLFLYALVDIVYELPSLCFLFFFLCGLSLSSPPAVKPFRPALGLVALAGLVFSMALLRAEEHRDRGFQILKRPAVSREDLRIAADHLERSRGWWPSPPADARLGQIFLTRARVEGDPKYLAAAAREYSRAVEKSPFSAGFHAGLGESLIAMGDTPQASVHFNRAAHLDPRGPYVGRYLQLILEERSFDVRTAF